MKDKLPAPTQKEILDLYAFLKEDWDAIHTEIADRRKLRWRQKSSFDKIPDAYKDTTLDYKTPEIQYNGQQAKALLLSNPPVVSVRPPNKDGEALATKVERFCNAGYQRFEELTHADAANVDTQIFYYAAVKKCYARRDRWPEYPVRFGVSEALPEGESDEDFNKRTEQWKQNAPLSACFEYTHVPIDTFFAARPDSRGIPAAMEVKNVNEWELMRKFGLYRQGDGEYVASAAGSSENEYQPGRQATVIEYWNREWRALFVKSPKGGMILGDPWYHGFGRVPYFIAGAYQTGETDTALQHIPLLWPLYPEAEENNRLHTLRSSAAVFFGWPTYYIKTIVNNQLVLDPDTQKPKVFVAKPGEAPQLLPGQEIVAFNPPTGFDLQEALRDSDDRIRRYALPPIATGNAPSGDSAGWNTQMLRHFLVTLLDPLVSGRAQQMAELWRFVLWSVKNVVKETVWVNAELSGDAVHNRTAKREPIGISPDDIVDYDIAVKIDPELETNEIAREEHGMNMLGQHAVSREDFVTVYRNHPEPEKEIFRMDCDLVFGAVAPAQIQKLVDWMNRNRAVEQVLAGASPEEVMKGMQQTEKGLGQGSPALPREPGIGMPSSLPPTGTNPTFQPEPTMGVPGQGAGI